jgi:serine/threonine-protein kinase ULK/ATG1
VGDYDLLRPIGSGAYSQVWLGRHRARGTEVAVKEIAMERLSSKLRESLLSEVDILRRIRHPNVIALHDSIKVSFDVARDLPCCCCGSAKVVVLWGRIE